MSKVLVTYGYYTFEYNYDTEEVAWVKENRTMTSIQMKKEIWEDEPKRIKYIQDWMEMLTLMATSTM